jgi:hypothetical protein
MLKPYKQIAPIDLLLKTNKSRQQSFLIILSAL